MMSMLGRDESLNSYRALFIKKGTVKRL